MDTRNLVLVIGEPPLFLPATLQLAALDRANVLFHPSAEGPRVIPPLGNILCQVTIFVWIKFYMSRFGTLTAWATGGSIPQIRTP